MWTQAEGDFCVDRLGGEIDTILVVTCPYNQQSHEFPVFLWFYDVLPSVDTIFADNLRIFDGVVLQTICSK